MEVALEAERQWVKSRWQKFEHTGEAVDHADVKSWAAGVCQQMDLSQPNGGP